MDTSRLIHAYMKGFRFSSCYSDTIHSCENQAIPRRVCAFTCRVRDSIICRARNSYIEFVTYPYIQKGNWFSYCFLGHTILWKSGNCLHRVCQDKVPGLCVKKTEKGRRRRRIKSSIFLHKVPGVVVKTKNYMERKKSNSNQVQATSICTLWGYTYTHIYMRTRKHARKHTIQKHTKPYARI